MPIRNDKSRANAKKCLFPTDPHNHFKKIKSVQICVRLWSRRNSKDIELLSKLNNIPYSANFLVIWLLPKYRRYSVYAFLKFRI